VVQCSSDLPPLVVGSQRQVAMAYTTMSRQGTYQGSSMAVPSLAPLNTARGSAPIASGAYGGYASIVAPAGTYGAAASPNINYPRSMSPAGASVTVRPSTYSNYAGATTSAYTNYASPLQSTAISGFQSTTLPFSVPQAELQSSSLSMSMPQANRFTSTSVLQGIPTMNGISTMNGTFNASPGIPLQSSKGFVSQAASTIQQANGIAMEYEIRPLPEDRIRRAEPVYKTESVAAPAFLPEPEQVADFEPELVATIQAAGPEPTLVALEVTNERVDQEVVSDIENAELMQALEETIPQAPRVCILGGQKFNDEASQPLVECLAAEFAARLADRVVVLTGGMAGVQETFANGCANGPNVVNMLPRGQSSVSAVGVDFAEFSSLDERIAVFGQIGDIYISVEGGPGVAKEALAAHSRGAIVLPLISTGGASGGMFDFPAGALEQPQFATNEQWDLLNTKGAPEATAQAVVDMIEGLLPQ